MPKKIRKEKELKFKTQKEPLVRVDNIHIFVIAAVVLLVLICACVGGYVYLKDKYHEHALDAFVKFEYTEKVDDGYNTYEITLDDDHQVYTYVGTPETMKEKKWSNGKYLDFNEELYRNDIMQLNQATEITEEEIEWQLVITLENGNKVTYSNTAINQLDKVVFADLMNKYFGAEILYK